LSLWCVFFLNILCLTHTFLPELLQHWQIYLNWNARLFQEMYTAFLTGRTDKDPSPGWYKGEIWFFDNYVIPLAKKLKTCGVFGVTSDEYLNYALNNRAHWKANGELFVEELKEKCSNLADARGARVIVL
jgi:hypothetical protein